MTSWDVSLAISFQLYSESGKKEEVKGIRHTCTHMHTHQHTQVSMHVSNIKEISFFISFQQCVWSCLSLAHHHPELYPHVSEHLRGLCMASLFITRDLSLGSPRDMFLNSVVIGTLTLHWFPSINPPPRGPHRKAFCN